MSKQLIMIVGAVALSSSLAMAQPRVGDVPVDVRFDDAAHLEGWVPSGEGKYRIDDAAAGRAALRVRVPERGNLMLQLAVPLERVRGMRVRLAADVRWEGVAQPLNPWNGVKVMVHSRSPLGPQWDNAANLHGASDWETITVTADVPANAEEVWVMLGLENTSGTAWFENARLTVTAQPRPRPAEPAGEPAREDRWTDIPRFRGVMYGWRGSDEDLRTLANWNVNLIRWQLFWSGPEGFDIWRDMEAYERWLAEALDELERWLGLCQKLGMQVLIDLHTPPGGAIHIGPWPMFQEQHYQDRFIEIWDHIAERFRGHPAVWGYDIVNEPIQGVVAEGVMDWRTLAEVVAQRIRRIDPDSVIVVPFGESGGWSNMAYFAPIELPGIIYTVHMYEPGTFTHQRVFDPDGEPVHYPGEIAGRHWDKETMRQVLAPVRQYQLDYGVHIFVGEFSAPRWAPGDSAEKYLRDVIELCEEYGWDWTYHAFREWHGWSAEHGPDRHDTQPAAEPTGRQRLLMEWFAKNARAKEN
jgi:endoglucanase